MIQDGAIVPMADWWKVVYDISAGTTFYDLEWPLTQNSRARYYSTLNISETAQDRDMVTMEY